MSEMQRLDTPRPPAPLLIMGSPRSGTTFLSQMVNRFFDHHVSRDNGTLLRFHGMLGRYEPLGDDRNFRRLIHDLYCDHFFTTRIRQRGLELSEQELADRVANRSYAGLIDAIFQANAEQHGKRHWGYKRASFGRAQGHQIDRLFPSARVVHIIRDARDVVLSMRNTPKVLLERSWHFAAADWASHVETGRELGRQLGPDRYLEIRYEQLMNEPDTTLARVYEFAGPGDDRGERGSRMRQQIGGLIKENSVQKWRTMMTATALRKVERVAGPLLLELGYPIVNSTVVGQRVSGPELAWLHLDRLLRNLFTRSIPMMIRYRVEVLKANHRSRSGDADGKPNLSSVR